MKNYICKKQKQGKIFGVVGYVLLAGFIVLSVIGAATNTRVAIGIALGCFVVCVPILVIYFELYRPMISSYNYLKKHGLLEQMEDINASVFDLPLSKISFGNTAFFSKKSKVVIPYSMVLWAYIQVVYTNGIKSEEKLLIGCRDRKWFTIKADKQELHQLLEIVARYSPDLILGHGKEQNSRYYEITKRFIAEKK